MAIVGYSNFSSYKNEILSLDKVSKETILTDKFLMKQSDDQKIKVYYAPFEHLNKKAKVVIVGITPGLSQMIKTYETLSSLKAASLSDEEMLQEIKNQSSFEGQMRKALVELLNELGLHTKLGISTTNDLFDEHCDLVHTTSVLPYPVFYYKKDKREDYNGRQTDVINKDFLLDQVVSHLPREINTMQNPLVIPLGGAANQAVSYLEEKGYLSNQTILKNFPHTSSANRNHMKPRFDKHYEEMLETIKEHFRYKDASNA